MPEYKYPKTKKKATTKKKKRKTKAQLMINKLDSYVKKKKGKLNKSKSVSAARG